MDPYRFVTLRSIWPGLIHGDATSDCVNVDAISYSSKVVKRLG